MIRACSRDTGRRSRSSLTRSSQSLLFLLRRHSEVPFECLVVYRVSRAVMGRLFCVYLDSSTSVCLPVHVFESFGPGYGFVIVSVRVRINHRRQGRRVLYTPARVQK